MCVISTSFYLNIWIRNFQQQFEQSGVAAVIASQQPMNMTGMDHVFPHQQPQYQMQGTAAPPTGNSYIIRFSDFFQFIYLTLTAVGIDGALTVAQQQQLQRPLNQQSALVQQQQQQQQAQQLANQHLLNDPNRMGMFNQQTVLPVAGQQVQQQQQQQQTIQQQQMIQQAAVQLQQQQSIIQQQHQQLLMMNSTNQEFMQMQHQAQHSKKMRKISGQNAALEQQQLMVPHKRILSLHKFDWTIS